MPINRDGYVRRLASKMGNGRVKIITGIRRCGKSYLLFNLFADYLRAAGVPGENIIAVALDKKAHEHLRDPNVLFDYILARAAACAGERCYVFIDEIQMAYRVKRDVDEAQVVEADRDLLYTTFYDVLNDLMARPNIDLYVTGSNSRMLSSDIATNFRDRGDEIRVYPLSFAEYLPVSGKEKADAWEDYLMYGGMPLAALEPDDKERARYLNSLFDRVYLADIVERYKVADPGVLGRLVDAVASAVGSLTNPTRLTNTLTSVNHLKTTDKTVSRYLDALVDAFLFERAARYDVKGNAYFGSPMKYYATDLGLRNARLNFRQVEETHLTENALYNELVRRGYGVDVGVVNIVHTQGGVRSERQHEIDFVVNAGGQRAYIQSAFSVADEAKRAQETLPLRKTGDFFKKIVVTGGSSRQRVDESGIVYVGVIPFMLDEGILGF